MMPNINVTMKLVERLEATWHDMLKWESKPRCYGVVKGRASTRSVSHSQVCCKRKKIGTHC